MIGLLCILSAAWTRSRLRHLKSKARLDLAVAHSTLQFRTALLAEAGDGVIVLQSGDSERECYGEGKALFDSFMETTSAVQGARAIDALMEQGMAFFISGSAEGVTYRLRGLPVGRRAVLYIRKEQEAADSESHRICDMYQDILERLPLAVAVFNDAQRLERYNGACAALWDFPRPWLDKSPSYEEILDCLRDKRKLPEQRNFVLWKQAKIQSFAKADCPSEEFWHMPNGKSVRVMIRPRKMGGKCMLMEDVTDQLNLKSSLHLLSRVHRATLDTLDDGIAVFGTDGCLVVYNTVFAKMWRLTENELSSRPHFADIANLCAERIGRDGIWGIVSCGINSASPERFGEWGKTRRADGRVISPTMVRLPDGATAVTFTDLTDIEQFSSETLATQALA
jgi:PAS domain-containing protein